MSSAHCKLPHRRRSRCRIFQQVEFHSPDCIVPRCRSRMTPCMQSRRFAKYLLSRKFGVDHRGRIAWSRERKSPHTRPHYMHTGRKFRRSAKYPWSHRSEAEGGCTACHRGCRNQRRYRCCKHRGRKFRRSAKCPLSHSFGAGGDCIAWHQGSRNQRKRRCCKHRRRQSFRHFAKCPLSRRFGVGEGCIVWHLGRRYPCRRQHCKCGGKGRRCSAISPWSRRLQVAVRCSLSSSVGKNLCRRHHCRRW